MKHLKNSSNKKHNRRIKALDEEDNYEIPMNFNSIRNIAAYARRTHAEKVNMIDLY